MSLELFWSLCLAYPAQVVNGLALFLALAGCWLLLATRWRVQRAAGLLLEGEGRTLPVVAPAARVERLNRFFNGFAVACLGGGLGLSWLSSTLAG